MKQKTNLNKLIKCTHQTPINEIKFIPPSPDIGDKFKVEDKWLLEQTIFETTVTAIEAVSRNLLCDQKNPATSPIYF